MRADVSESKFSLNIKVFPETPEEMAALARFAMNVNSVPPDINLSLTDTPNLNVYMPKISPNKQDNSISSKNRK